MLRKVRYAALAVAGISVFAGSANAAPRGERRVRMTERRPQTVLYEVREDATPEQRLALQEEMADLDIRTDKMLARGKVRRARSGNPRFLEEEEIADRLEATGAVEFAEPDYLQSPELVVNDTRYSRQWHLPKISAPSAWDYTAGSASVLVAVCDSGVQADHPDLKGNLQLPGYNTVSNNTNSAPITTHGTKVAGTIAAMGNNGLGVAGVAFRTKILPVRVSNSTSGSAYTSDLAECVRYAGDRGARVVNLSFTGSGSSTIDSAAKYLRSKGGLLFMAAGNSGKDISSSADFTSFLVVGSTTSSDTRSSFSNYGKPIDIVAPGSSISTTTTGSSYATVSGTSFSSPVAAGVGALIFAVNPAFTPAQVESIIMSTATDLGATGDDFVYGRGRVNAYAAVRMAMGY